MKVFWTNLSREPQCKNRKLPLLTRFELQSKFDFTLYKAKMIYQLDDLIKKTSLKSSRLIYKCSKFALFCCQVSNSSRPWHRALIEGVIFRKCINAVYVIFFSYRDGWYVTSKTSERVSVFIHTKRASRLRDCGITRTHFFARGNFTIDRPFSQ